jgi:hypothetical protein
MPFCSEFNRASRFKPIASRWQAEKTEEDIQSMIWLRFGNLLDLLSREWVASLLFILLGGLITWILACIPDRMEIQKNDD